MSYISVKIYELTVKFQDEENYSFAQYQQDVDKIINSNVDWTNMIEMCEAVVTDIICGRSKDDDNQYVYECAMKTVYGDDIFTLLNKL